MNSSSGDNTGTIHAAEFGGRVSSVQLLLSGTPHGAFAYDSHYQSTSGALVSAHDGAATWSAAWSRLYYLSGSDVLDGVSVSVDAASGVATPASLVVTQATLTVEGSLSGLEHLSLVDGGSGLHPFAHNATGHSTGGFWVSAPANTVA